MNLQAALEGILFLCGDEGICASDIANILDINQIEVLNLINNLIAELESTNRGIKLEKFGDIYKLVTKKEYNEFFEKLVESDCERPLTIPALEVLAIIAYNEPVTRIMVDEIRGVNSSHMIRSLRIKGLIEEVGKADLPGKPILYKTTDKFLDIFGLKSTKELPNINLEINDEVKECDLFRVKYTEK